MGASDVVEQVRTVAGRVAASYGLEIFDVSFRREGPGMVLRVQIDRPGPSASAEDSVSVTDCVAVSRDLSAILDVEDVVPTAYTLEVSSPGLDRVLRKPADFRRFASAPAFMGFTGLTPSEYSSGARTRRGAITKAGPQLVRGALIEAAWSYRHRPAIGATLRRRQAG